MSLSCLDKSTKRLYLRLSYFLHLMPIEGQWWKDSYCYFIVVLTFCITIIITSPVITGLNFWGLHFGHEIVCPCWNLAKKFFSLEGFEACVPAKNNKSQTPNISQLQIFFHWKKKKRESNHMEKFLFPLAYNLKRTRQNG